MTAEDPLTRAGVLDEGFLPFERRILLWSAGGQRGFLLLRMVLAAVLILQTLALETGELHWRRVAAIPAVYAAASFLIYRLRSARRLSDALGPATFLFDVAAALAVLRATEGRGAHIYTALLLMILGACFLKKPLLVFTVGIAVCLAYALLAFPPSEDIARVLPLHLSLMLLIALFSVHLADYAGDIERRTARLYEERLAWMQRLSIVGKAMAAVLHEAKTPLGTIVLNAESAAGLLRKGKKPSSELRTIASEADHAAAILQNFLDFVKPTRLDRRPLLAHEPLLQALGMLRVRLDERGVAVSLKTLEDCRVLASARHLLQAFTNVLNNAVDAMPSGGKIEVWMERREGTVRVHFQDTGAGMSPETLGRLFEPFSTSKAGEEGHGLGLGIVRWIAVEHDGDVGIASDGPGRGSRVTLTLPLAGKS